MGAKKCLNKLFIQIFFPKFAAVLTALIFDLFTPAFTPLFSEKGYMGCKYLVISLSGLVVQWIEWKFPKL